MPGGPSPNVRAQMIRDQQRRDHPYEPGVTLDERIAREQARKDMELFQQSWDRQKKIQEDKERAEMERWREFERRAGIDGPQPPRPPQPPPLNPFDLAPPQDPWGRPVNPFHTEPMPAPGAPQLPKTLADALQGFGRKMGGA